MFTASPSHDTHCGVVTERAPLSVIVDRIGALMLGVKRQFDVLSGEFEVVSIEDAIDVCKDLGLTGDDIEAIERHYDREQSDARQVDFSTFLLIYAEHTGLSDSCGIEMETKNKFSDSKGRLDPRGASMWVPLASGRWTKVKLLQWGLAMR